jgi:hypothetical protein
MEVRTSGGPTVPERPCRPNSICGKRAGWKPAPTLPFVILAKARIQKNLPDSLKI